MTMLARGSRSALAVIAATLAALLAPGAASAAAPANDNFADREVLTGPLPIEVTRANDEATKEPEESLDMFAPAGHSVWFEWEATSTGWVTIGACDGDDEFMRILGVFTGTAVNGLTKVADGNGKEGPFCAYSQRQYTFRAQSGTKYEIAVDGNIFTPSPETPDTEGAFTLRIEQTPAPENDDFAAADVLASEISEEPDGHRVLWVDIRGYNWLATKEADEPDHAADPGGASVWYSWTAPETGIARIGTCCAGGPTLLAVYQGSALTGLTAIAEVVGPPFGYPVQAGATYKIAVDGARDEGTGEPKLGSFGLQVFMELASGPGYGEEEEKPPAGNPPPVVLPIADTSPPQTTIQKRSLNPAQGKAAFRFSSSEAGSSYRCRIDKRPLRACQSPATFKNLGGGWHTFRVKATDAAGNADPSAAVARFKFPK